jgi:hypothetical protein
MVRRHGEGVDWRKEPVDAMVVYIYAMVVLYIYDVMYVAEVFHIQWYNWLERDEGSEGCSVVAKLRE